MIYGERKEGEKYNSLLFYLIFTEHVLTLIANFGIVAQCCTVIDAMCGLRIEKRVSRSIYFFLVGPSTWLVGP